MDTEEIYRHGVADAERGEPHPFYYQHYYQYRRAYDRARRSRGLPGGFYARRQRQRIQLAVVLAAILMGSGGLWLWRNRSEKQATSTQAPQTIAVAGTMQATRTPVFSTPTLTPAPTPLALRVGGQARVVNIVGAVLRGRKQPNIKAAATASFREGEQVTLLEGPVEADGFTWWRIEGSSGTGWSAQQSKDGTDWLQAINSS